MLEHDPYNQSIAEIKRDSASTNNMRILLKNRNVKKQKLEMRKSRPKSDYKTKLNS